MTERQSTQKSKIKNNGLDRYDVKPFKQQQFGTAGVQAVKAMEGNGLSRGKPRFPF